MKLALSALFLLSCLGASAKSASPSTPSLPRNSPESQGVSSSQLLTFIEAADQIDAMHSFMLIRHGHVVAEGWWTPHDRTARHELYSLSKSFTSTAIGLAVAEGKLSVDDEVLKFFPDEAPADPGGNLKAMRVRDLLTMSTGHQEEPPSGRDKISAHSFFAQPVPHKPGTHFKYNTPATFMQSAIVQKVTGQTVLEYLRPRLFVPLGIQDPTWDTNFQGISLGGYGLSLRTEDIARFGQLYLQRGKWNGRQLIPESWVAEATSRQVSNGSNPKSDWDQGYGYQFWRCRPHGAYRGDGAFGQYCIVLPDQDAVVAITSGVKDMPAILNLVWEKLLPAIHPKRLRSNRADQEKLTSKLTSLSVKTPLGNPASTQFSKWRGRTFVFNPNDQKLESVAIHQGSADDLVTFVTNTDGIENRVPVGHGNWKRSRTRLGPGPEMEVAASGAWVSDDTLLVKICAFQTPYHFILKLRFDGDRVFLDTESNVGFGPVKQTQRIGEAR